MTHNLQIDYRHPNPAIGKLSIEFWVLASGKCRLGSIRIWKESGRYLDSFLCSFRFSKGLYTPYHATDLYHPAIVSFANSPEIQVIMKKELLRLVTLYQKALR